MVVLVSLSYTLIIYLDSIPLYRKKLWRDFGINMALTLLTFTIAFLISLDVAVPSPVYPIQRLIITILGK